MRCLVALVIVEVLLAGCESGSETSDLPSQPAYLSVGRSTQSEVEAKLGGPSKTIVNTNGSRTLTFDIKNSRDTATSYVPVIGATSGLIEQTPKKMTFTFSRNGILRNYGFSPELVPSIVDMKESTPSVRLGFGLKQFVPWPPPLPSYHYQLDSAEWRRSANKTLGDEATFLVKGLRQLGYGEYSYFDAPNGFVLATALERIRSDGIPDDGPTRWGISADEDFSTSQQLQMGYWRLLMAPTGYYRFMLIVVTTDTRGPDSGKLTTLEKANSWSKQGSVALNSNKSNASIRPGTVVYLNIYEFSRRRHNDPVYDPGCKVSGELQVNYLLKRLDAS